MFFEIARAAKQIGFTFSFSLKMLKAYSITIRDGRSTILTALNELGFDGVAWCLTVRVSAFPKTERGCLLSDIPRRKVPDSYFLSMGRATNSETLPPKH